MRLPTWPHGDLRKEKSGGGFTLIELLVAVVILVAILVMFSQMITQSSSIFASGNSRMSQFREGRAAFDTLVSRLSGATVGSYNGYQYTAAFAPQTFYRRAELRFLCGPGASILQSTTSPTDAIFFVAPLGNVANTAAYGNLPGLLNICGYYIEWSNADVNRPSILPGNGMYRFRLMQFIQPSEAMLLYSQTANYPTYSPVTTSPAWQITAMTSVPTGQVWARPVATNAVALLLLPALSTTDTSGTLGYTYNSEVATTGVNNTRNRLPPVLRVVLYTIDEASAKKLGNSATMPALYTYGGSPLFTDATKLYPTADGTDGGDLQRFESVLGQNKLNYRRFETAVQLASAPWNSLLP